jgi:transposase InsO family protein
MTSWLARMIVLDRGPQFASIFWELICSQLGIDRPMSRAFHSETDGQTEWMNTGMEQYLPVFVNHQQDDWVQWLSFADFAEIIFDISINEVNPIF